MRTGSSSVPGSFGANPPGDGPSQANQPVGVPSSATSRISGRAPAIAAACAWKSGPTTNTAGSACARISACSGGASRKLSGTSSAPSRAHAKSIASISGWL